MKKIEYFFDCSSPWTYLSFRGILELRDKKDFEIIWKPILVGGIFNSINPSVYESRKNPVEEKLKYSQKDLKDWANLRNLEINWPKIFPINSVKAMRGAFHFLEKNTLEDYLESVFEGYWTHGIDISNIDTLLKIVEKLGEDQEQYEEVVNSEEAKQKLIENTQELMERGGFGSPTFFVNGDDMYFGNDRIQLLENIL
jgi:2-hydroxychromene-2-carboxylate isomerase